MAQVSSAKIIALPGIVTDQPEIYESEPVLREETTIDQVDLLDHPSDESIALIEVPIKQAFSYFAERENEIAKFYVQRHGEYKISGSKLEDETDIEKYHRLVSEVNQLLIKFQADRAEGLDKSKLSAIGSLDNPALINNLEILARQLKALEFAAQDGSLNTSQLGFLNGEDKIKNFGTSLDTISQIDDVKPTGSVSSIRLSALERRLNMIENLIGGDEAKLESLQCLTKTDNFADAADTLGSWVSLSRPEWVQKTKSELDYLSQRMEASAETRTGGQDELDTETKTKLEQLCELISSTDKHRSMLPTILHRLNAMEELQSKAATVVATVNHLEQVQAQIVDNLQSNKDELSTLKETFAKNIQLIKEYSKAVDSRIASIKSRDN